MKRATNSNCHAFTLLELLIVIGILSALAFSAVSLVDESDDHIRLDTSRARLFSLRQGVIGEPSSFFNRPPVIQGYVSDMGRLPNSISELINQGSQPTWNYHTNSDLWAGWRGPYLHTTTQHQGIWSFPDGWGNTGDTNNFGWRFEVNQNAGTLVAQSYGADGVAGGTGLNADYPADGLLVREHEALVDVIAWRVIAHLHNPVGGSGEEPTPPEAPPEDSGLITICHKPDSKNPKTMTISLVALPAHLAHGDYIGACETEEGSETGSAEGPALPEEEITVRLRIFYPSDGGLDWPAPWPSSSAERDAASYLSLPITISPGSIPEGEVVEVEFDFGPTPKPIPMGVRSLAIVEDSTGERWGAESQPHWRLPLLPKTQLATFRMAWALE